MGCHLTANNASASIQPRRPADTNWSGVLCKRYEAVLSLEKSPPRACSAMRIAVTPHAPNQLIEQEVEMIRPVCKAQNRAASARGWWVNVICHGHALGAVGDAPMQCGAVAVRVRGEGSMKDKLELGPPINIVRNAC